MKPTYDDISWEVDEVIDEDLDGSGTQEVLISGFARCSEGGGHFEFKGTATRLYPYEELTGINIEESEFIPDEPEQKETK